MTTTARSRVLLAGAGLAALTLSVLLWPEGTSSLPPTQHGSAHAATESTGAPPATPDTAALPLQRAPADDATRRVRVVDDEGNPIARALCAITKAGRRTYRDAHLLHQVHTDEQGFAALASSCEAALRTNDLLVWSQGHRPGTVPGTTVSQQEETLVVLHRAPSITLRVTDSQGIGIPDVRLSLSISALPANIADASDSSRDIPRPGTDVRDAVHTGRTDADGTFQLHGVAPGLYVPHLLTTDFVVTNGLDRAGFLPISDTGAEIQLARVYVCCAKSPDNALLSYIPFINDHVAQPQDLEPHLRRIAGRIRRRIGGDIAHAVVLSGDSRTTPPLKFRCLLDESGWQDIELPFLPASEIQAPTLIDPQPVDGHETGRLSVRLADLRDIDIEGERIFVFGPCPGVGETAFPISTGTEYTLPIGTYSLKPPSGARFVADKSTFELRSDQALHLEMRFADARSRCRFRVTDSDGAPVTFATLTLRSEGFSKVISSPKTDGIHVTVPIGPLEISVFASGATSTTTTVNIGTGADQTYTVRLGSH